MVSRVFQDRFSFPPDPVADFEARRPEILQPLLYVPSELRNAMIKANFDTAEPFVYTLGAMETIQRPLSRWKICKLVINQLYQEGRLLTVVCESALMLSTAFVAVKIAKLKLRMIAEVYHVATRSAIAELCLSSFSTLLISMCVPAFLFYRVAQRVKQAYQNSMLLHGSVRIQPLLKIASSGADLAKGLGPEEVVTDILSQQELSKEEVQRPQIIVIGKYASDILSITRMTLSKPCPQPGQLPHPIENRAMSPSEQDKFLQDIANFFVTDVQTIFRCWEVDVPDGVVQKAQQLYPGCSYDQMKKSLDESWRYLRFRLLAPYDLLGGRSVDWRAPPSEIFSDYR